MRKIIYSIVLFGLLFISSCIEAPSELIKYCNEKGFLDVATNPHWNGWKCRNATIMCLNSVGERINTEDGGYYFVEEPYSLYSCYD